MAGSALFLRPGWLGPPEFATTSKCPGNGTFADQSDRALPARKCGELAAFSFQEISDRAFICRANCAQYADKWGRVVLHRARSPNWFASVASGRVAFRAGRARLRHIR